MLIIVQSAHQWPTIALMLCWMAYHCSDVLINFHHLQGKLAYLPKPIQSQPCILLNLYDHAPMYNNFILFQCKL